jgi:hypothetical protein
MARRPSRTVLDRRDFCFRARDGRFHIGTMQHELVRDGKTAKQYGPYWYAYAMLGGRTRSVYVGRDYDEAKALERLLDKSAS